MVHLNPLSLALLATPGMPWTLHAMGRDASEHLNLEPGLDLRYEGAIKLATGAGADWVEGESPLRLRTVVLSSGAGGPAELLLLPWMPASLWKANGAELHIPASRDAWVHAVNATFRDASGLAAPAALGSILSPFARVVPLPFGGAPTEAGMASEHGKVTLPQGLTFATPVVWSAEETNGTIVCVGKPKETPARADGPIPARLEAFEERYEIDPSISAVRSARVTWTTRWNHADKVGVERGSVDLELKRSLQLTPAALSELLAQRRSAKN